MRLRFVGTNQGVTWNNVMYLRYTPSPPNSVQLQQMANVVMGGWGTYFRSWLGTGVHLNTLEATDINTEFGAQAIGNNSQQGTDINAQDQPLSAAACLSWTIQRHYRGGHPRFYLPFCASLYLYEGRNFSPTYMAGMGPAASSFISYLTGMVVSSHTYYPVCVSYQDQKVQRPIPAVYDIVGAQLHPRVDTRRRRLGKEGN